MPRCYAEVNPTFQKAMRLITAITNAPVPQVTTSFAHNYITGQIVRLDIPPACGMQQITGKLATITLNSDTTFLIDIDTTQFDSFAIPVLPDPHDDICAQVIPVGQINQELRASTQNVLPYPAS